MGHVITFRRPGHPPPVPQGPTVADLLDAYTKEVLPHKAPKTRYQEERLFRWIRTELGHVLLTDLTPAVLRQWRDRLSARYAPGTVRRYLDSLSGPLTFAVAELEWLPVHPMRGGKVRKPPQPKGRTRCLTLEEKTALLAACQASRNHYLFPIVILALHTGMRKEEIRQLTWDRVDLEGGCVRLIETKNGDTRVIPLVGHALEVLRQLATTRHPEIPWLFPRWDGLKPTEFARAWEGAVHMAGIPGFHFHDLRHTAASYLAMSGASLIEIAQLLGHKTLQMTMKYAHLTAAHHVGVAERMATKFLTQEPTHV